MYKLVTIRMQSGALTITRYPFVKRCLLVYSTYKDICCTFISYHFRVESAQDPNIHSFRHHMEEDHTLQA